MLKPAPSSGGAAPNAMMQKHDTTLGFGMSCFDESPSHAQFVASVIDFDMNAQAPLAEARFIKGDSGCTVIQDDDSKEVFERLAAQGHQVNTAPRYSLVMGRDNVTMHDDKLGVRFGASDRRADRQAMPEMPPYLLKLFMPRMCFEFVQYC